MIRYWYHRFLCRVLGIHAGRQHQSVERSGNGRVVRAWFACEWCSHTEHLLP